MATRSPLPLVAAHRPRRHLRRRHQAPPRAPFTSATATPGTRRREVLPAAPSIQVASTSRIPRQGLNDWSRPDYGGPCPPIGRHRSFYRLYALDTVLPDLGSPTRARFLAAIRGHVVAEAQLIGTYEKTHPHVSA